MIDVPIEGYKSITIRREVYEELKSLAERTHRSVPGLIEHLIEKASEGPSQSTTTREDVSPTQKEAADA
ncbi:hypothetical protein CW705_01455 [Candidatus Bathyarchaeota archaeon]|nr:MAG: hypothetical protein CW705_01455 [Candidatus Bathyarchaeota archaeon]